jgi:hypothetical protein
MITWTAARSGSSAKPAPCRGAELAADQSVLRLPGDAHSVFAAEHATTEPRASSPILWKRELLAVEV